MMCRHSRRLFSRRLDDRLSDGERQALEAHLSGCARCRTELAGWEASARALRAIGPAGVPDGLAERTWRAIRAAIAERPARMPASFEERFVWAARRAAVIGVLAAAVVWGGVLWRQPGGGEAAAELALPPDAAEIALSLWAADAPSEVDRDDE